MVEAHVSIGREIDATSKNLIAGRGGLGSARLEPSLQAEPALTRRSFWVGLLLVGFTAVVTPYNDYVIHNAPFIGNHFPIGLFALMMVLVLGVNPLLQAAGRRRLGTGELAMVLAMMFVGAAAPSSGLIRYLESGVIGPFRVLDGMPWFRPVANLLPSWVVPTHDWHSALVRNYFLGIDTAVGDKVPVWAFLRPAAVWSVLIAAIFGATLFWAAILRKQWVQHERLSYPLATIPLELLTAPEPGFYFNGLWRNPVLWAGASLPLLVHLMSGWHEMAAQVPRISLAFDFTGAFTERPWDRIPHYLIANRLYLSVVGVCFFIPLEVALSLWLFLVISGLAQVAASSPGDLAVMEPIRGMGVYAAYFAALLWLARRHLGHVAAAAWRGDAREADEVAGYRTMVVGLGVCWLAAWAWLSFAGIQPVIAALVLVLGWILVTLMARVAAETGLFFLGANWQIVRWMEYLLGGKVVEAGSFYLSAVVSNIFFTDLRETLMPFAVNSLRLTGGFRAEERGRVLRRLAAALVVSVAAAGVTQHYLAYHYGREVMRDDYSVNVVPVNNMGDAHRVATLPPTISRGRAWTHFGFGVGMVAITMVGRLLWVWWPFHPIGLLLMDAWPLQVFWFSIFVGWGVKRLLLRYGGATLFRRARAFFIGLIVGEMLAFSVWLVLGLVTNGGLRYQLFPG